MLSWLEGAEGILDYSKGAYRYQHNKTKNNKLVEYWYQSWKNAA
jgi:hypothetical protein